MDKDNLIKFLEKCVKTEESAIPLYAKHIESTLFLSGFDEKKRQWIINTLEIQKRDSMRHRSIFEKLIYNIQREKRDVY